MAQTMVLPDISQLNSQISASIIEEFGGIDGISGRLRDIADGAVTVSRSKLGDIETVDFRTRLAALQLAVYYIVGRPIERQQVLTAKVESETETDLIARLAHSPAMREALRGVLEAAEGGSKTDV